MIPQINNRLRRMSVDRVPAALEVGEVISERACFECYGVLKPLERCELCGYVRSDQGEWCIDCGAAKYSDPLRCNSCAVVFRGN